MPRESGGQPSWLFRDKDELMRGVTFRLIVFNVVARPMKSPRVRAVADRFESYYYAGGIRCGNVEQG